MKKIFFISSLLVLCLMQESFAQAGVAKSLEDDKAKIADYQYRCETIKELLVSTFKLTCFTNYNHYAPGKVSVPVAAPTDAPLKIANYNLLHPGTSKALFKDYALIAQIMNQYDVVSGLELLATVGRDEQNNKAVLALLNGSDESIAKLKEARATLTDNAAVNDIDDQIKKIQSNVEKARSLYRAPGYLRVLQELKKLDPSWGLVLSPRGDSALIGSVEELTGFYYRGSRVSPSKNPHCEEFAGEGAGSPIACFTTLTKDFIKKDVLQHFARRPFMATFKSRGKKFTLVTSHVVFTYSGDEDAEKDLMKKTFGVDSYKSFGVGTGITAANFARFAEVKNTLEFMNAFRKKYNDSRIMYLADTNLVSNNAFWPEVLKSFPGGELLITEPTTLSPARYTALKKETNGVANDYDHFILDKSAFPECDNGSVYNYYNEKIYKNVEKRYVIREEVVGSDISVSPTNYRFFLRHEFVPQALESTSEIISDGDIPADDPTTVKLDYPLTSAGQSKMDRFVANFEKYLRGLETVKNGEVVADDFQIKERLDGLRRRVFLRQLTNSYYYRFMQEVLSDHFPVALTCDI